MYDTEHTITVSTIRYRTQTREHIWCMTQNTQYRSPCPLHTQAHHNRESWRLPLVGRNFAFWTQCQTQHPRKVALVPAMPRISKEGSFGNSKYICMGILSHLPTRCVNTSFLWPGEVWIKHRQCYPPDHVQVKQPTILPYCIRVFANTRQFASCHLGPLFLRKLSYQALGICVSYFFL